MPKLTTSFFTPGGMAARLVRHGSGHAFYLPKPYVDSAAFVDSKGRRWVMYEQTKPLRIEMRAPEAIELDWLEELPDQAPSLRQMELSFTFS